MLELSENDQRTTEEVRSAIEAAIQNAENPVAVAKRIVVMAVQQRNRGRRAAMRRHPFRGICERSGKPLLREHAHLDEIDPERGYEGPVRWVCPRANNSGRFSCGACE